MATRAVSPDYLNALHGFHYMTDKFITSITHHTYVCVVGLYYKRTSLPFRKTHFDLMVLFVLVVAIFETTTPL